jgi:hypothetical protein
MTIDKNKIIRDLKAQADVQETRGARYVLSALKAQGQSVNQFVKDHGVEATQAHINTLITTTPMMSALLKYYQSAGVAYAGWQYRFLREHNPTKSIGGDIAKYVSQWLIDIQVYVHASLGKMIQNITDTTRQTILDILDEAKTNGYGAEKTARMITDKTNGDIGKSRALVIARTEGTRTASFGHKLGSDAWAKEAGSDMYKRWYSIIDNRTRPDHKETDGETVEDYNKFNVGGYPMDAPGDANAPASETVNCRCRCVFLSSRML